MMTLAIPTPQGGDGTLGYTEYLRRIRCGEKIQYSSEMGATNAAIILSWLGQPCFFGLEAYPCNFCEYWHVGHPYFRGYPRPRGEH